MPLDEKNAPNTKLDTDSGVLILKTGDESLLARLALINSAQESLDLQYYAINNDITSNILIEAIVRAADRGVNVRLLIDDISIGKIRKKLIAFDCIKNVSVRIFNPVNKDSQSFPARITAFFLRLSKSTRRMHNKALIADRNACITGGRNLGDEYFDAHKGMTFKDIDVLSLGRVTTSIYKSFEAFWNDSNAYRITDLYKHRPSARYLQKFRDELNKSREQQAENMENAQSLYITFDSYINQYNHKMVWARCDFLADKPEKASGHDDHSETPVQKIAALVESAKKEFLIVSPYFVPGKEGMAWLSNLIARHIKIGVVTNSLASTDVVAVHTGYRSYRQSLLAQGIALYELKPINGRRTKQRLFGRSAPSYASLHAKIYVVDLKIGIISSFNFDPRSAFLNTESALVVYDETIAKELADVYQAIISPDSSYHVTDNGGLLWKSEKDGMEQIKRHEPEASFWRRLQASLIGFLPIEKQL